MSAFGSGCDLRVLLSGESASPFVPPPPTLPIHILSLSLSLFLFLSQINKMLKKKRGELSQLWSEGDGTMEERSERDNIAGLEERGL